MSSPAIIPQQIMEDNLKYFLEKQYPQYKVTNDGTAIAFMDQDANYRVCFPVITTTDSGYNMQITLNHIRGGGDGDDDAIINVYYDQNGQYTSAPTMTMTFGGNVFATAFNWVGFGGAAIIAVTGVIAGIVTAIVTGIAFSEAGGLGIVAGVLIGTGVSTVFAAVGLVWAGVFEVFAALAGYLDSLADDGGRSYFIDVVAHTQVRVSTATMDSIWGEIQNTLAYSFSNFKNAIDCAYSDDKNGYAVQYQLDGQDYRTWEQDFSVFYGGTGMIVSCKVDGIRNDDPDDHLFIMAGFDASLKLISATCVTMMESEPTRSLPMISLNENGQATQFDPATQSVVVLLDGNNKPYSDIVDAVQDKLTLLLQSMNNYSSFSQQRKDLPQIAKMNLEWITKGCTVNSRSWTGNLPVNSNVVTTDHSPSITSWNDMLYLLYIDGTNSDNNLVLCTANAAGFNPENINLASVAGMPVNITVDGKKVTTENSPAIIAVDGNIYGFYIDSKNTLQGISCEAATSSTGAWNSMTNKTPIKVTGAAPAVCFFQEQIYIVYREDKSSNNLCLASYNIATKSWNDFGELKDSGNNMFESPNTPALAADAYHIYMTYQDKNSTDIRWAVGTPSSKATSGISWSDEGKIESGTLKGKNNPDTNLGMTLQYSNGLFFMVYTSTDNNYLTQCILSGTGPESTGDWIGSSTVTIGTSNPTTAQSSHAPSLAITSGGRFLVYRGDDHDEIYWAIY